MTEACNYRCEYCAQDHTSKPKLRLDPRAIAKTLDETRKQWVVAMTGGEPFLYPGFVGRCAELSQHHRIAVDTNLSLKNRVADFAERVPVRRVSCIFASTHSEERERRNGCEEIIASATLLFERGFNLLARVTGSESGFPRDAFSAAFAQTDRTLRAFYDTLLRTFATSQGKRRFDDKTPHHFLYAAELFSWYPKANMVMMVRDPRAAHASLWKLPGFGAMGWAD